MQWPVGLLNANKSIDIFRFTLVFFAVSNQSIPPPSVDEIYFRSVFVNELDPVAVTYEHNDKELRLKVSLIPIFHWVRNLLRRNSYIVRPARGPFSAGGVLVLLLCVCMCMCVCVWVCVAYACVCVCERVFFSISFMAGFQLSILPEHDIFGLAPHKIRCIVCAYQVSTEVSVMCLCGGYKRTFLWWQWWGSIYATEFQISFLNLLPCNLPFPPIPSPVTVCRFSFTKRTPQPNKYVLWYLPFVHTHLVSTKFTI